MIENLPLYISIVFGLTTITTLLLFYFAIQNSTLLNAKSKANWIHFCLVIWLILQAVVALNGFYLDTSSLPPKFIFTVGPPLLTILILFATKGGRSFIDSLPLEDLTYLNIVRIPVELVLYWLSLNKAIPELMTFAGRNFDVLSGLTAPFIAYFAFTRHTLGRNALLAWNLAALALLINIVANAVLSAPFTFQQFAFEQPNIAILYFPFNWLPAFVVPVVLFGHLVSIRRLLMRPNNSL